MNLDFLKVQRNSAEIVQTNWILHLYPPVVQVETTTGKYDVLSSGRTFKLSPHPEAQAGCPFPGLVIELAVRGFLYRHRDKLPLALFIIAALTVSLYITAAWLVIEHPAAGEMLQNVIMSMLLWTIATGGGGFALFIAYNFFRSGQYVWKTEVERANEIKLLPAAVEPDGLSLGPDVFVLQKAGESKIDFLARLDGVRSNLESGVWAVSMDLQNPIFAIWQSPTISEDHYRNSPPFHADGTPEEDRIVPTNAVFDREDHADFLWYAKVFALYYRQWAPGYKLKTAGSNAGRVYLDSIRASANILLFLLFAVGLSAQSSKAVSAALGTRIREIPAQGADISYMFSKKSLNRIGNGRSDYIELLTGLPGYNDRGHGDLIAVYNGGEVVAKGPAAEQVEDQPKTRASAMRPISAIPSEEVTPEGGWSLPDSLSNAKTAEWVRFKLWEVNQQAGGLARPWWDTVIFVVWMVMAFIALAFCICFYWAFVAAKEGMYNTHKAARKYCAYIALSMISGWMIQSLLYMLDGGLPVGACIVLLFIQLGMACVITNKFLIPNFSPDAENESEHRAAYTPISRQLR